MPGNTNTSYQQKKANARCAATRSYLMQPGLNIENLPERFRGAKILPAQCIPQIPMCPQNCYPQNCVPQCCPQPCQTPQPCYNPCPVPMPPLCPPPCPPYPYYYPCQPSPCCMPYPPCPPPCPSPCPPPGPPPCCPPDPFQMNPMGKGQPGKCGGAGKIICVPKGQRPPQFAPPHQSPIPGFSGSSEKEQPASFNNCNFYVSELPKGFNQNNGMGGAGGGNNGAMDNFGGSIASMAENNMNSCGMRMGNQAGAGDDRAIPPPVGYPGSTRKLWGTIDEAGVHVDKTNTPCGQQSQQQNPVRNNAPMQNTGNNMRTNICNEPRGNRGYPNNRNESNVNDTETRNNPANRNMYGNAEIRNNPANRNYDDMRGRNNQNNRNYDTGAEYDQGVPSVCPSNQNQNDGGVSGFASLQASGNPSNRIQPSGYTSKRIQTSGNPSNRIQPSGNPSNRIQPSGNPSTRVQPSGNPSYGMQSREYPSNRMQPSGYTSNRVQSNVNSNRNLETDQMSRPPSRFQVGNRERSGFPTQKPSNRPNAVMNRFKDDDYCIPQDHDKPTKVCKPVVWRRKRPCCMPAKAERLKTLCQTCHNRFAQNMANCGLPMPDPPGKQNQRKIQPSRGTVTSRQVENEVYTVATETKPFVEPDTDDTSVAISGKTTVTGSTVPAESYKTFAPGSIITINVEGAASAIPRHQESMQQLFTGQTTFSSSRTVAVPMPYRNQDAPQVRAQYSQSVPNVRRDRQDGIRPVQSEFTMTDRQCAQRVAPICEVTAVHPPNRQRAGTKREDLGALQQGQVGGYHTPRMTVKKGHDRYRPQQQKLLSNAIAQNQKNCLPVSHNFGVYTVHQQSMANPARPVIQCPVFPASNPLQNQRGLGYCPPEEMDEINEVLQLIQESKNARKEICGPGKQTQNTTKDIRVVPDDNMRPGNSQKPTEYNQDQCAGYSQQPTQYNQDQYPGYSQQPTQYSQDQYPGYSQQPTYQDQYCGCNEQPTQYNQDQCPGYSQQPTQYSQDQCPGYSQQPTYQDQYCGCNEQSTQYYQDQYSTNPNMSPFPRQYQPNVQQLQKQNGEERNYTPISEKRKIIDIVPQKEFAVYDNPHNIPDVKEITNLRHKNKYDFPTNTEATQTTYRKIPENQNTTVKVKPNETITINNFDQEPSFKVSSSHLPVGYKPFNERDKFEDYRNAPQPQPVQAKKTETQTRIEITNRGSQEQEIKIFQSKSNSNQSGSHPSQNDRNGRGNDGKRNDGRGNDGRGNDGRENNGDDRRGNGPNSFKQTPPPPATNTYRPNNSENNGRNGEGNKGRYCKDRTALCVPLRNCKSPRMITCQGQRPILSLFPPACPIRETNASILSKKPPQHCSTHDQDRAPFQDHCMVRLPHHDEAIGHKLQYTDYCAAGNDGTRIENEIPVQYRNKAQIVRKGVKRRLHA